MNARTKLISKAKSVPDDRQYREWLKSLKGQIRCAQAKAAIRVNVELLRLYWGMGRDIAEKRMEAKYGSGFFENLSRDLKLEFPDMEGFSPRNLRYVQAFYRFYSRKILHQPGAKSSTANRHQPVDEFEGLFAIPWRHHVEIFTHAKSVEEGLFYVAKTAENGWSRNVLMNISFGNEYFIDFLFYHLRLRRFVVIELKTGELKPEDVGQLGFYVQTVNEQLRHPSDGDAIGLLICKRKKRLVAEYALKSTAQLVGVSEYKLTKLLPRDFKSSLPSVKDIEAQLSDGRCASKKGGKK